MSVIFQPLLGVLTLFDLLLVVVALCIVVVSARRGGLVILANGLHAILGVVVAYFVSGFLRDFVWQKINGATTLTVTLEKFIDSVLTKLDSAVSVKLGDLTSTSPLLGYLLPENVDLSMSVSTVTSDGFEVLYTAVESFALMILQFVLILVFSLLFSVLFRVFCKGLSSALHRLPLIGLVDNLLGMVLGAVFAVVLLAVVSLVPSLLTSVAPDLVDGVYSAYIPSVVLQKFIG